MARPPHKQLEILAFLERQLAERGELPDLAEVARVFDIRYSTLRGHLEALAGKGHLNLESRGPGRSPRLILRRRPGGIPLFGEIAAGLPAGAYPDPEGHLALRGLEGGFALRVRGDSMAERIQEGDVVLLQRGQPQRSGEICAVRVGTDETTLKYLDWSGSPRRYTLRPHNPDYPTLLVDPGALHIDGLFRSLLRGEVVEQLLVEGSDG
ncbi:MAG: S24 family peptidase [Trueperaceae bacterium]